MTSQMSDHLLTQKVCIKVVDVDPGLDVCVPEDFKTQETCIEAVRRRPSSFFYVPNHLMT